MRVLFKKREDVFIARIHDQAALTLEGLEALNQYFENNDPETAKLLTKKEKDADEARRILIDELNRTFVTPFDREDIFALSGAIDDVLDYAYSTANEMDIFGIQATPYMRRIAALLRDAAFEILQAVDRLEEHPNVAGDHVKRAKALENRVEETYREALADLFSHAESLEHMLEILKFREVYRHLSNAADRGDEAANAIANIVVKIS
jgi:predicted phosphate transport protein (TIGR00153 family)